MISRGETKGTCIQGRTEVRKHAARVIKESSRHPVCTVSDSFSPYRRLDLADEANDWSCDWLAACCLRGWSSLWRERRQSAVRWMLTADRIQRVKEDQQRKGGEGRGRDEDDDDGKKEKRRGRERERVMMERRRKKRKGPGQERAHCSICVPLEWIHSHLCLSLALSSLPRHRTAFATSWVPSIRQAHSFSLKMPVGASARHLGL